MVIVKTLNFHIPFWGLQAYVLRQDEVIDFSFADQCQSFRQPDSSRVKKYENKCENSAP